MTTTSVDLYVDLIAAAYDAKNEDDTQKRTAAYYAGNAAFAFAAALRLMPSIDIARAPALEVLQLLQNAIDTGMLRPAVWYREAVLAARRELERYTAYVYNELGGVGERMSETGAWGKWTATVKLTDLKSQRCPTWRRIKTPRAYFELQILDDKLPARVLLAKSPPAHSLPHQRNTARVVLLSSARVYMDMAKCAVRDSLRASLNEAVQLRLRRMSERAQPTAAAAGVADLIPNFAPTLDALHEVRAYAWRRPHLLQETDALLRQYTDCQTLTQSLTAEIEEAERQHRRLAKSSTAALFNQSNWFVAKLRQMAADAQDAVQVDDDDNQALRETVDADLSAAFQTFGAYLAQKFIVTQIGIIQNELEDAADMAALVLPEERVRRIAEEHLRSLGVEDAAHNADAAEKYAEYERDHARRVVSFRVEQSHLASQSDASLKMIQQLEQAAVESKQWLRPNDSAADNIRRLLTTRVTSSATANLQPPRLSHATRLLLFCRELANSISEIRSAEIGRNQEALRCTWATRDAMLAELIEAVGRTDAAGNVNDEPWESRLPILSVRADVDRLLPTPIGVRLRTRLLDFVVEMTKKVKRPLPIRPRGARDQCTRVVADLEELFLACSADTVTLAAAWLHLPCVLWSETYTELVDSVDTKRHAADDQEPAAKRAK